MDSARGGPSRSGRETPASGRQSPSTGRRKWGGAIGRVEAMLQVSTALDLYSVQRQRRALRDVDPWLVVEKVRGLCQRRSPRPYSVVQDLVIHAGFLCGFIREQPLEAQFRLCQVLQFEDVGRGKLVCRQGEPGDRFYMIIHGCVSVQCLNSKRQVRNLGNLGRGDYFGDIALINGQPRQATCITRSDTCLLTVNKDEFLELYKNRFSVRCVQAIKFLRKQVRPFLSLSEPSLRLFAHYLCLMCFNPGTTWNVDEDGTLYFVRAGESELLIPLAREDPRFKVEGPYISVTRFKEGDYFGESSVFPEDRCGWLVRALTPMQLFAVRGKDFLKHADPVVVSTIRSESAFRVSYYAGRHNQPTPQLTERPSTRALRLSDAQRRRSRRSTNPHPAEPRKAPEGLDGTQPEGLGDNQLPSSGKAGGLADGGSLLGSPKRNEKQAEKGLPGGLGAKGVIGVLETGLTGGLADESASPRRGGLSGPRNGGKQAEKGLGGGFPEGSHVSLPRGSTGKGEKGLSEVRTGTDSTTGRKSSGSSQSAAVCYTDETKGVSTQSTRSRMVVGSDELEERRESGNQAGSSGSATAGARQRGDRRPSSSPRKSPAKSPLGFSSVVQNRTSRPSDGEGIEGEEEVTGEADSKVRGREVSDGDRIEEAGHLDSVRKRPWTSPKLAALDEGGRVNGPDSLTGPGVADAPAEDGLVGQIAYKRALSVSSREGGDTQERKLGEFVKEREVMHSLGMVAGSGVNDDKALPQISRSTGADSTAQDAERNVNREDREVQSQTGSPSGDPERSPRRRGRRARWRVRARSALSSVEGSLETARRIREEEFPGEAACRGGLGSRTQMGKRPKSVSGEAEMESAARDGAHTRSGGVKFASEGGVLGRGFAVSAEEKKAVELADAEVARRSAPKAVVARHLNADRGGEPSGKASVVGAMGSQSAAEMRAGRATRLAQVYGPQKPVRRGSTTIVEQAASSAPEMKHQTVSSRTGGQSVTNAARRSPERGEKDSAKKAQTLPLLHQVPGRPEHAREAMEVLEKLTGVLQEETPVLPPVDISNLPTPSEIVLMELGPEENRSLSLVPLAMEALTLPWQAYTIPVASSRRWEGIQTEQTKKEKAKAAKLHRKTGLSEQQLKQSELQAVAYLRNHAVDLVGGRDLH